MEETEVKNVDDAVAQAAAKKISPYRSRFHDALWFDKMSNSHIMVLGCGGIGSNVIFLLSRIGTRLTIFDMDLIETHNLGGQLFGVSNIGQYKTEAIQAVCNQFSGFTKIDLESEYTEQSLSNPVVVAAFDNMKARKIAFDNWVRFVKTLKPEEQKECIFIDGRLQAEDYQVYAVTPGREEEYLKTLFADSEVDELPCTLKSTTHCSWSIASEIVSILTNFYTNITIGDELREVPFSIIKGIQSYSYTTK